MEADAVIVDGDLEDLSDALERDGDAGGFGVLSDIVERFADELHDVGGHFRRAREGAISADIIQAIREALNNVRKHSKATRVAVALEKVGKILEISIDDNGVGFHFSGAYTLDELDLLRMGPVSLKRRARSLGADLLLESRPGHGAGLKMKVPV